MKRDEHRTTDRLYPLHLTRDGGVFCRRENDEGASYGVARQAKEGVPLAPGSDLLFAAAASDGALDCVTVFRSGPAQVATEAFRDGWARTFGKEAN